MLCQIKPLKINYSASISIHCITFVMACWGWQLLSWKGFLKTCDSLKYGLWFFLGHVWKGENQTRRELQEWVWGSTSQSAMSSSCPSHVPSEKALSGPVFLSSDSFMAGIWSWHHTAMRGGARCGIRLWLPLSVLPVNILAIDTGPHLYPYPLANFPRFLSSSFHFIFETEAVFCS